MLFPMLERLEENIVNTFIAGKPIIDSPKQLRSPFKFRHVKNVSASVQAEYVIGSQNIIHALNIVLEFCIYMQNGSFHTQSRRHGAKIHGRFKSAFTY